MTHPRTTLRGRGLTLAEVIFAMGILAIYAVGILSAAQKAMNLNLREQSSAAAYRYGEEQVETMVRLADDPATYDDVSEAYLLSDLGYTDISGTPTKFAEYSDPETGNLVEDRRYFIETTVEDLSADLKRIRVIVRKQHPDASILT